MSKLEPEGYASHDRNELVSLPLGIDQIPPLLFPSSSAPLTEKYLQMTVELMERKKPIPAS